ncbi:DMT family transporter [Candidatus Bipolaricaulota bacterium]|nr:DMT family transporter [Candidatus Bipolaricaulota bacterium]
MNRLAPLALLMITVIWGWTFVIVKEGVGFVGPLTFLSLRFSLALLFLAILFHRSLRRIDRHALFHGMLVGLVLFFGYFFQTWGLIYTSATKSGLITGLSVVIVPLLAAALLKEKVHRSVWAGAFLAAGGLFLLVMGGAEVATVNMGDFLTLLGAFAFAGHIILIDRFIHAIDYRSLLIVQVGTVAVLSVIGALFFEPIPTHLPVALIHGVLITGLMATALAFYILNRFQAYSTASYTAIILAMEPVFAGLFGFLLLGERLTALQGFGGGLLLIAICLPLFLRRGRV